MKIIYEDHTMDIDLFPLRIPGEIFFGEKVIYLGISELYDFR